MKPYKQHTLKAYLESLSQKTPVPGGGSAAALAGALGAALISMVANYSIGKGDSKATEKKLKDTLARSEKLRKRLLELVDLDAKAYLGVVKTRKSALKVKTAARKKARAVPLEISKMCYEAVKLTPFLASKGNKYLISDVKVALELLLAAFQSALINVEINQ